MRTHVELDSIGRLIRGEHENPFSILGPHEVVDGERRALAVRAFLPSSSQVWVVDPTEGETRPMRRIHPAGLFEAICPMPSNEPQRRYQLQIADQEGRRTTMHDPYAFPPLLSDYDIHLLCEGKHWKSYEKLGAHLRTIDGVSGVNFAVWAPNAMGISVVGNFNHWNAKLHPMRKLIPSGFWELFIPGLGAGEIYKFHIRHSGGHSEKADPYGFAAEVPPRTASIVADINKFEWQDVAWMQSRDKRNGLNAPLSFYEVHLGSWRRPGDKP
ncbi:MAG: hypothetical protein JNG90_03835, partial [Planctomycetaceae bacterium]|nr:hypothetical protein [Planctomycetaceae bacterium]